MSSAVPEKITRSDSRHVLLLAAWFGLVTGLVEGPLWLLFQQRGWLNWEAARYPTAVPILWFAPLTNLALFLAVGVVLLGVARIAPRMPLDRVAPFAFGFLSFFDWLAISSKIRLSATLILSLGLASVFQRWHKGHGQQFLGAVRRSLPWAAAAAVFLLAGIEGGTRLAERRAAAGLPAAAPGSPNILILLMDTVRADHVGSYGYYRATTPNIDRLAERGVLFENAFAASSWTLPSHASLLTGRYPHEHGVQTGPYRGGYPMLSQVLKSRGYRTAAISANVYYFNRPYGFGPGFLHFEDIFATLEDGVLRTLYGRKAERYVFGPLHSDDWPARRQADGINASLLGWLGGESRHPFFVFVNYYDAHDPYHPPQPYRSRFSKRVNPGGVLNEMRGVAGMRPSPEELQGEIDAYDGGVTYVDHAIGEALREIGRRGLAADTMIIVTSDHGEALGENNLYLHRNALYRELIRVPLVIVWPGHVPAGVRVARPVSNVSLAATIMDLLGSGDQKVFPTPSLTPFWSANPPDDDWPYPLAELAQMHFHGLESAPAYYGAMKTVVTPHWQLIQHEKFGASLYDWIKDPGELQDLSKSQQGKLVTDGLLRCMREKIALMNKASCGAAVTLPSP